MKNNKNSHKKKMAKSLVTAGLTAAISMGTFAANNVDATANFKDVPSGAYYEKAVYELSEKGVIGGYSDGTFQPDKAVTRAEAAKMLAYDLMLETIDTTSTSFNDVKNSDWFYQPVTALSQAGGIGGYENGTFRPQNTITRAEIASMLVKAYSLEGTTNASQSPFQDVPKGSWYAGAVQTLIDHKITSGITTTKFAPDAKVTRKEIAAFISKVNTAKQNNNTSTHIIEKIADDNTITISGKTYAPAASLNGILNNNNGAVLQNAKIQFKENNGIITDITYLQINSSGQTSDQEFSKNTTLDGNGNTINGKLEINANYVTVKNIIVSGDLEITSKLQNDFYSEKITVKGKTIVKGGDDNTVVFKDANLGIVDVQKKGVRVESKGQTSIKELVLSSDATIAADENIIIPKVTMNNGANLVQLDGYMNLVDMKNSDAATLKGTAVIKELQVNSQSTLSLAITNIIGKVTVEDGKIALSADTSINDLQFPSAKKITDIVTNYESVKNNINNHNEQSNIKPTPETGGGGNSGTPGTGSGNNGTVTPTNPVESVLNSYEDDLDGLINTAHSELDTILEKNNYLSLPSLYDRTKASFEEKYKEIKADLMELGLSERDAALKIQNHYTQLADWKDEVYNKLRQEGFSDALLNQFL